jgi:alpha-L-rhamnosidase
MRELAVSHLRCDYLVDPLGIDEDQPRLSWSIQSDRRGARQTAYRIQVAASAENLAAEKADYWDSGRVESDQTTHVVYAGSTLRSREVCQWWVLVWDEAGNVARSVPARWTMGLLGRSDWSAQWIAADPEIIRRDPEAIAATLTEPGSVPLFRKSFRLPQKVRRATLYTSARGLLDLWLNGRRVTEDCFLPEWTHYHQRLHYRTFDVTPLLATGENVVGAMLGDGWWSGYVGWQETRGRYGSLQNSLLLQLEVELEHGQTVTIVTDQTWRCETGPILASDFMMGELYDARRERTGWDGPGFDDTAWLPALVVAPPKVHIPAFHFSRNQSRDTEEDLRLVAQRSEPVRVVETLRPISVKEVRPRVYVYDLGQNIAGWVRIAVRGPAGTRITLRHGERLNPDGTLYTENLRRAKATDGYILAGRGEEVWQPRFTFHGFQYIELSGLNQPPPLHQILGCVVMSATPPAGQFECSNPLVTRLWKNALWGQKGNFLSVPTDCPQRDERLGWLGDAQVFLRTATYNMDVAAFFTKWMTDVTDSQDRDGIFPDVAPRLREDGDFVGLDGLGGGAGWADAGVIIPYTMWRVYGDVRMMERNWDAMVRWMDWLERTNPDGLRTRELHNNYGDWLCIPSDREFRTHSPMKDLLATAYWADDAAKMSRMARALGYRDQAQRFEARFEAVRSAFQKEWLRADGELAVETQTAYLLALAFDLLPQNVRAAAAERLVANIRDLDWHLSTGFIGVSHLNPQLTLAGHGNVAYRLLLQDTYPSWLYPVRHGATTIWERWNGWTEQNGFFDPLMNSFNHYSLGSVGEWLFRHVAGIELDPEACGFQRFVLQPFPDSRITSTRASYRTMHGEIVSDWKQAGDQFIWTVRVPPNTTARVHVPSRPEAPVSESGQCVEDAVGVRVVGRDAAGLICAVGAGTYHFQSSRTGPDLSTAKST